MATASAIGTAGPRTTPWPAARAPAVQHDPESSAAPALTPVNSIVGRSTGVWRRLDAGCRRYPANVTTDLIRTSIRIDDRPCRRRAGRRGRGSSAAQRRHRDEREETRASGPASRLGYDRPGVGERARKPGRSRGCGRSSPRRRCREGAAPKTKSVGRQAEVGRLQAEFPGDVGDVRGRPTKAAAVRWRVRRASGSGEDEGTSAQSIQADRRAAEVLERRICRGHVERRRRAVADYSNATSSPSFPGGGCHGADRRRNRGVHRDAVHRGDPIISARKLGVEADPVDSDALARTRAEASEGMTASSDGPSRRRSRIAAVSPSAVQPATTVAIEPGSRKGIRTSRPPPSPATTAQA